MPGLLLYGLHYAWEPRAWPVTDPYWLIPLYSIAILVPVTLEILNGYIRRIEVWLVAAAFILLAFGLGTYTVWSDKPDIYPHAFSLITYYISFFLIWFIALPFVQSWLRRRDLKFPYSDLFEFSHLNPLLAIESTAFTVVFWGLLWLWAALFSVVGISFFADLFKKPAFIYLASALTFGYATFLIQSRESIVITLRRHILGVFSWLFPLAALIAAMFLIVLPATGLAPLWKTGYATFLMLCLQALFIHFLNAAYEDGERPPAYPAWLAMALRIAVFTLPIYAALCIYSLGLRVEQHGWSVQRIWAAVITLIAALYGLGYAFAATRRSSWMNTMAPINVWMSWVVAALLLLLCSPLLDPKRLALDSQLALLSSGKVIPLKFDYDYLRTDLGRFGNAALSELSKNSNPETAKLASQALERGATARTAAKPASEPTSAADLRQRIKLYPPTATLDPSFLTYLEAAVKDRSYDHPACLRIQREDCLMLLLDLNQDGRPEIISLGGYPQAVYSNVGGQWQKVGDLVGHPMDRKSAEGFLRDSKIQARASPWLELRVGDHEFFVQPSPRSTFGAQ